MTDEDDIRVIDPPVSARSSPEAITEWINELLQLPESPERDGALARARSDFKIAEMRDGNWFDQEDDDE